MFFLQYHGLFCFTSAPLGQLLQDWTNVKNSSRLAQTMGKEKNRDEEGLVEKSWTAPRSLILTPVLCQT